MMIRILGILLALAIGGGGFQTWRSQRLKKKVDTAEVENKRLGTVLDSVSTDNNNLRLAVRQAQADKAAILDSARTDRRRDSIACERRVRGVQMVVRDLRNGLRQAQADRAFLESNPVRVDLIELVVKDRIFAKEHKILDSTYTEGYKWVKD